MKKWRESEEREWWEAIWTEQAKASAKGDKVIDLGELAGSPEGLTVLGIVGALAQFPQSAFERQHIAAAALRGDFQGQWWGRAYAMMAEIRRWRFPQMLELRIYDRWREGGGRLDRQPSFEMDPRILAVANAARVGEIDDLLDALRGSQQLSRKRYREIQGVGTKLLDADPDLAAPQPGRHEGPGLPAWSWEQPKVEPEAAPVAPVIAEEFETAGGSFAY